MIIALAIAAISGFCLFHSNSTQPQPATASSLASFPQDVYVWQREGSHAVLSSINDEKLQFRRFVILAAEFSFHGRQITSAEIHPDYAGMGTALTSVGLAIRIGPLPGNAIAAMATGSAQTKLICESAITAVDAAHHAGLNVSEVQIDFDCAESKLPGYLNWVKAIKAAVAPAPVAITVLPSWLKHAEFAELAKAAGSFVLQVHSLHKPAGPDAPMTLCDAAEARAAVERAARIGVPFRVALPTYSYLAGFSLQGNLLGLSAEGPPPAWPAGAVLRVMRSDPASLAELVRQWSVARPAALTGLIWYRLPIPGDTMNWSAPTLHAVMAGREPIADVRPLVVHTAPGLLDLFLQNAGDADGSLQRDVSAEWTGADLVAAGGINGFESNEFEKLDAPAAGVTFHASALPVGQRIAPGERIQVGWLRLSADKEVQTHVSPRTPDF